MTQIPTTILDRAVQLLAAGGRTFELPVRGASMRPLLEAEDLIVVRPGVASLGLGDVILFRQGDVIWAHRVIEVEQNGGVPVYITMGDAARTADEPVGRDQVLGRVVAVKKAGGTIRLETFLQQVYGRVAALRSRRRAKPDRWPKP